MLNESRHPPSLLFHITERVSPTNTNANAHTPASQAKPSRTNKPAELTAAIGQRISGINQAVFMR